MVDARAVRADVALDAAPSVPSWLSRCPCPAKAFALAPIPRRNDLAGQQATPRRPRRQFRASVRMRIPPVRERPTFRDHPRTEVHPGSPTHRHDPSETVPITILASNRSPVDPTRKRTRRVTDTRPPVVAGPAALPALRPIDPVQQEPDSAHIERVAVDHTRGTRHRVGSLGNSNRRLLLG